MTAAPVSAPRPTTLEFRGFLVEDGKYFFSLYETSTQRSEWVGLNENGTTFTVRAYDAASQTVTGENLGRTVTLTLKHANIVANAPSRVPSLSNSALASGTVVQWQPPTAPMAPDARIADEIRRRHALRQ